MGANALSMVDYSPFEGDGRKKVVNEWALPGTMPIKMTNAGARMLINSFLASGHSNHSGTGGTLWIILEYCQRHRIPYQLLAYPNRGYRVERITNPLSL